ncbi:MAG: hypothetical protein HY200_03130 [Nitrospirae bacterium]|nr:hypothetical protein [Nitrospirota bacterium]MBI3593926.1 hypothetical protein [Nitrospirota bacterium]
MITKVSPTVKKQAPPNVSGYRVEFIHGGSCQLEGDQSVRAAVGFVSFGSDQRPVNEAMAMFKKINFPAASFYLDSQEPFPARALEEFADKVYKIVVIDSDSTNWLSRMIREETWINPVIMAPPNGGPITVRDIFEKEDWN